MVKRRSGSTSAAAIERAEAERRAIELRTAGYTYDEIAEACGLANRSVAYKHVKRGLSRWMRDADEELRALELARTDALIQRLWPLVDCPFPDLKVLDRLLRLLDYRARIAGLYAPQRQVVAVKTETKVSFEKVDAARDFTAVIEGLVARELPGGCDAR